jgi:hypothetical protein
MAGRPLGKESVDILTKLFSAAESVLEGGFRRSLEYNTLNYETPSAIS